MGEGNFTAELTNGLGARGISLYWQSLCISSPKDSIEEYAAQILTVTFHPTGQPAGPETSGFAVSFNSAGRPQILRLVNSPVNISHEDDLFEEWLDPIESTEPNQQQLGEEPAAIDLEAELKHLEQLKQQAEQLDAMARQKDAEIRKHLLHDCTFISSRLKHCKDLKCFIRTSFKIVPDIFRLMKYKFGPLPSSVPGSHCRSSEATPGRNSSAIVDAPRWNTTTDYLTDVFNVTSTTPSPSLPDLSAPVSESEETGARARHALHHIAVVLLTLAVALLLIKISRNTVTWKRKRADFAARREEIRTRRAYRSAACRYRWRLWWQGFFRQQRESRSGRTSQHDLPLSEARESIDYETDSDDGSDEGGIENMGVEILGLRRVFEYVGELVGMNGPEDPYHYHNPQELGGLYTRAEPAPSSTAPLTTVGSPRTSSVLSYETSILDTVDSLESETATIVSG